MDYNYTRDFRKRLQRFEDEFRRAELKAASRPLLYRQQAEIDDLLHRTAEQQKWQSGRTIGPPNWWRG